MERGLGKKIVAVVRRWLLEEVRPSSKQSYLYGPLTVGGNNYVGALYK